MLPDKTQQDMHYLFAETALTTCGLIQRIREQLGDHLGAPITYQLKILRFITKGIRVGDRRVKLEAIRHGGKWVTSWEAWLRFQAKLTTLAGAEPPREPTPAQRTRDAERARAERRELGTQRTVTRLATQSCLLVVRSAESLSERNFIIRP